MAKKVCEALRYSDPLSHQQLEPIEAKIQAKFNQTKDLIARGEEFEEEGKELLLLIQERNGKCKLLK